MIPTIPRVIQVAPGVTTNDPERWLMLAKERGRRLRAAVEAGHALPHLLDRWEDEMNILTAEIRRVTDQSTGCSTPRPQLRGGAK